MTNVKLNSLVNANAAQKVFADEAITFMKNVVNHQPFLDAVFAAKYSATRFKPDQGPARSATNAEILQSIVSGKEHKSTADQCIDLKVVLEEYRDDDVVGGMTPPNPLISTNLYYIRYWMGKKDALSLAAHWMHEWMHVAGYRHLSENPDTSDVVYKVGYLFRDFGVKVAQEKGMEAELLSVLGQGYLEAMAKVKKNNSSTIA